MTNKQIENISKQVNKLSVKDESFEEYTHQEIEYLDKYKEFTNNRFDDDELYEIIIKYNFDDERIIRELSDMLKLITKKGDEYGWQVVEKGKKTKVVAEAKKPEYKEPERKQYRKQYKEYNKDNNYKTRGGYNYQNNYYRGRGRGRAGARGRGAYRNRFDEDRYFQQEVGTYTKLVELQDNIPEPTKDIKEESAEEDFLFSDNNRSPSPKKVVVEQKIEKVEITISPKNIDETIFASKNIISNIKEFIDTPDQDNKFKSHVTIQNTSFNLINKQPEKQEKQPNRITTIQNTFTKTSPIPKKEPQTVPESNYPYMMPMPMFYYPQGYDPNLQQQGQYPPMYYFIPPYGMNPNDLEEMRRKGQIPQYNPNEMNQGNMYPYAAPFNYYYSPYGQTGMNPMTHPMNMGGMDNQYNYGGDKKK